MTASIEIDLSSIFSCVGRFEADADKPSLDTGTEAGIYLGAIIFRAFEVTVYLVNSKRTKVEFYLGIPEANRSGVGSLYSR